jgi:hypothetical protein
MKHMMIDLETLALDPKAIVFQAGVVVFDDNGEMPMSVRLDIDVLPQIMQGRSFDPETQKWWMEQDPESWRKNSSGVSVNRLIDEMNSAFVIHDVKHVWANSPSFDCVILRSLAKDFACDLKWDFRSEMDVRTLKSISGLLGLPPEEKRETTHDALKDCIDQALRVIHYMAHLRQTTVVNSL